MQEDKKPLEIDRTDGDSQFICEGCHLEAQKMRANSDGEILESLESSDRIRFDGMKRRMTEQEGVERGVACHVRL